MALTDRHVGLLAALREAGLPVSLAEDLDAARALRHVDWDDRERLRTAYAACVVKSATHRRLFDELFDLWFPRSITGVLPEPAATDPRSRARDSPAALRELTDNLLEALASGDVADRRQRLEQLAGDAVGRFGGMAGRTPDQSGWSTYNTLRRVDPDALIGALLAGSVADQSQGEARIGEFKALVEADVRRRVAIARGPEHVARTFVKPSVERVDFTAASRGQLRELRREIQPLARRLAVRAAKEQHARRGGPLDFRRTVRAALSTGGVPVETRHRPRRPHRPELVVLCDVSGSVANFATFTLMLLHALHEQFTRVRAFTFVDTLHEVTDVLDPAADPSSVLGELVARSDHASRWGRTNYGQVYAELLEAHADALGPKVTLLILGDARSNHADLRTDLLREIRADVRRAWWLNPEARRQWASGDSAAREYAEVVDMHECRNLVQLGAFVRGVIS